MCAAIFFQEMASYDIDEDAKHSLNSAALIFSTFTIKEFDSASFNRTNILL